MHCRGGSPPHNIGSSEQRFSNSGKGVMKSRMFLGVLGIQATAPRALAERLVRLA